MVPLARRRRRRRMAYVTTGIQSMADHVQKKIRVQNYHACTNAYIIGIQWTRVTRGRIANL